MAWKLLQRIIAVMELVARYVFEQSSPDDFIAFFLARRTPGGFHTAESLLEPRQCLLATFAANLDLRGWQRRDQQCAWAGLDRLGQRLNEREVCIERQGKRQRFPAGLCR